MTRRGFFSLFSTAAAAAVIDPEALILVPKRVIYSIPAPKPSSNLLLTPEIFAQMTLFHLQQSLQFSRSINAAYDGQFDTTVRVGETLSVRVPIQHTVRILS